MYVLPNAQKESFSCDSFINKLENEFRKFLKVKLRIYIKI